MLRRCRLLCSLALVVLTLLAAGPVTRGEVSAPDMLVEVKNPDAQIGTLLLEDGPAEPEWTMVWTDFGAADGKASAFASGGVESVGRLNLSPPPAPAVIAAPLPPALLSGLMGLVGVYAYQRTRRIR